MENIFKGHVQDGSHWIFNNEDEYNELLSLIKYFKRKILFNEEYNPNFNAITFWCDGAAVGKYNSKCRGVFPITYEYYHLFYKQLANEK